MAIVDNMPVREKNKYILPCFAGNFVNLRLKINYE